MKLAQVLACFPPDFVGKPFSHLNQMMELVAPFDPPGETVNFMLEARDWIDAAIAHYKGRNKGRKRPHRSKTPSTAVASARWWQPRPDSSPVTTPRPVKSRPAAPGEETKELDAWVHLMEGNDLIL